MEQTASAVARFQQQGCGGASVVVQQPADSGTCQQQLLPSGIRGALPDGMAATGAAAAMVTVNGAAAMEYIQSVQRHQVPPPRRHPSPPDDPQTGSTASWQQHVPGGPGAVRRDPMTTESDGVRQGVGGGPATTACRSAPGDLVDRSGQSSRHHRHPQPLPPSQQQQQQQQQQQKCAACGREIADRFLLHAIDRYWHTECLRCSVCQSPLADLGSTCFTRSGMTLCRTDYIRLFGLTGTCSACQQSIPPNEFVMKTQDSSVYHVTCFACVTCHGRLVPGDRYGIVNGRLVCEHDYVKAVKNQLHDQQSRDGAPMRQHHKVC